MNALENCFEALEKKEFHKMIVGAAIKDFQTIEDFSYLYTHANTEVIDISAFPSSVLSAQKGIQKALTENPELKRPLLMVSVSTSEDPHFRRIELDTNNCTECMLCIPSCPADAFSNVEGRFHYNKDLCYGCSDCLDHCSFAALELSNWPNTEKQSLKELQELGATAIEYHLGKDPEQFTEFYKQVEHELRLESFCIGSELYDTNELIKACKIVIEAVREKHGDKYKFIIQVDGMPQSGAKQIQQSSKDIACFAAASLVSDFINKEYCNLKNNIYIQIAGGIDNNSLKKSRDLDMNISGVAMGSFARKQVNDSIKSGYSKKELINFAKKLISSSKAG